MIDLVGHFGSHLSYATVAEQLAIGLDDRSALGNIVNLDDKILKKRWLARPRRKRGEKVIVIADAPYLMESLTGEYRPEDIAVFVCPNTDQLSEQRRETCCDVARIYTPSRWCASTISTELQKVHASPILSDAEPGPEVIVMPLGIDPLFLEEPRRSREELGREDDTLRLLHVTTDTFWPGRKGTEELIEAWSIVRSMWSAAHRRMSLTIHCLPGMYATIYQTLGDAQLVGEVEVLTADGRGGESRGLFDLFERHDMLVAPSRSEGFGIMPLSALMSGMPALTSTGTGQDEYLAQLSGWLAAPTLGSGELYGEDGEAPSVDVERLVLQIVAALHLKDELSNAARANESYGDEWSWITRREAWAKSLLNWEKT